MDYSMESSYKRIQCFIFAVIFIGHCKPYGSNIALYKPTNSSSYFEVLNVAGVSRLLVDGDSNPDYFAGHCFHSADLPDKPNWVAVDLAEVCYVDYVVLSGRDSHEKRMDYFLIGLLADNIFYPNANILRGSYPLCGQYKYPAVASGRHTLKCNGNLPAYRYLIAQQPSNGPGYLTICELEVYEPSNFNYKRWKFESDVRMIKVFETFTARSLMDCLSQCHTSYCDSVNFYDGACELNSHLNGYLQTDLLPASGWRRFIVEFY